MIELLPIAAVPPVAIESLLDAAFGTDRHGRTAYKLRAGMDALPGLSLAAVEDGELVGSIQCWPIQLTEADGDTTPLILVGPVAVRPDRQRDGIGRLLMDAMIEHADASDHAPLVLIGDPEYYGRFFGFDDRVTGGWAVPGPVERRRLLARVRSGPGLPREAVMGPRVAAPALVENR
ncbi:GNAT family N-acetyltransferase [Sphingomonas montanisoli]|uniref:N-acetyltransferase n=1 Tax=Sphingomonas montanisoli TaxID=2606412 RepID=A0A5D9C9M9_9SPHN|nr:N-acetyltransferase [Sphingomonas montanisoli]TZG27760.1 N-acetyltransferase [Sphingomonas montanisoli]